MAASIEQTLTCNRVLVARALRIAARLYEDRHEINLREGRPHVARTYIEDARLLEEYAQELDPM